jgi:hypothetical protein
MAKQLSRVRRLAEISARAFALTSDLQGTLDELYDLQQEYQEWRDNLPENLESSPIAEKLDTICEIDIEGQSNAIADIEAALSEFADADLPLGFGKD